MACNRFEFTVFLGAGIFLTGVICFVAVAVNKVLPAKQEQNLKEINCTVAYSEINGNAKCYRGKQGHAGYPCLKIYVICGEEAETNRLTEIAGHGQPIMLHKSLRSVHHQCSYQPDECTTRAEETSQRVKDYQLHNGKPSTFLRCYYNPERPQEVFREKASEESYERVLLQSVLWPLAVVLLGVVVVVSSACFCSSRRRSGYEKVVGVSKTSLQQTL